MLLPVTLTIAAACAIINLWLALRTGRGRLRGKIMMGDGGSDAFVALARSHSNFAEYAPFVLILIGAIEFAGGSPTWLWVAGVIFVVARIMHPLGMTRPAPNPLRAGGFLLTVIVTALLAGWALTLAYGATRAHAITTAPVETSQGLPSA